MIIKYKCDTCRFKDTIDVQMIANPTDVRNEMEIRHEVKSKGTCSGKLVRDDEPDGIVERLFR